MAFAPEFNAVAWLNSEPLTLNELKGKIVLVDFWTYSCINCIRTLPHLIALYNKYASLGLVIVGVHTPEFEFEKELKNVKKAVKDFGITYPVAIDSDWKTWNAYQNSYWPRQYLISEYGEIEWDHAGEGNYDEIEKRVRAELQRLNPRLPPMKDSNEHKRNMLGQLQLTRETYLGSSRSEGFGSASVCIKGSCHRHIDRVEDHDPEVVYLSGDWEQEKEFVEHNGTEEGYVLQKFTAKELNLVMAPAKKDVIVTVFLDGKKILKEFKGADVDAKGNVAIDSARMYRLFKAKVVGQHEIKIVTKNGLQAFAFTYG